jgi:hypothetical protein
MTSPFIAPHVALIDSEGFFELFVSSTTSAVERLGDGGTHLGMLVIVVVVVVGQEW